MKRSTLLRALAVTSSIALLAPFAVAQNQIKGADEVVPLVDLNADWPCVQKRIDAISVSQVWDGPSIEGVKDWYKDQSITQLITKLATRRIPMEEAEAAIKTFAAAQPEGERDQKLTMLFAGLFDKLSRDRRAIMNGIEKYQKAQRERSLELERQTTEIVALEKKAEGNEAAQKELAEAQEKFNWAQRIFAERQGNIPVACELPIIVEERLFAVARAIRAEMKS